MGVQVAVKADMADLRGGNEAHDAVHHVPKTGAQNRHDGQLARDHLSLRAADRV